jgi:hypothetical protein
VPGSSNYAESARRQADQILSRPPFTRHPSSTPHPLAGVLHFIGHVLDDIFGPIGRFIERYLLRPVGHGFHVAFGSWSIEVAVVLAVIVGVVLTLLVVRRRARIESVQAPSAVLTTSTDPEELEAEADRMEAAGDRSAAFRLRFAAGLLRLERAGLVPDQQVRTDAEVGALLGSPTFDRLARRHEAVAYGGDAATGDDLQRSRQEWPRVPDEARRHRAASGAPT